MLKKLSITNFAIIDHVELELNDGFSVITGETGAGKSIILGALNLISGERVDAKQFNHNDKKTVIEATFDMARYDLKAYFEENDLEYYDDACIIRREILPNSRSRAFVNDSPVSLTQLKGLTVKLIDIHSQHNNILLSDETFQLSIIDNLADNATLCKAYSNAYSAYNEAQNMLADKKMQVAAARADEDYNKFLLSQFENLNLIDGEEEELETEQKTLANVAEIKGSLWEIENLFDNESAGILDNLKSVGSKLDSLSSIYSDVEELSERIESSIIELKDISATVSNLNSNLEDNPTQLEYVNARLDKIMSLKKKHNVSTIAELLIIQEQLEAKMNAVDNGEYEIAQLEKKVATCLQELTIAAKALSESRKATAKEFQHTLNDTARPLGLANIQCEVRITPTNFTRTGSDHVQLLISFNKNQPLMPIGGSASGGEISRLMLSIKSIIAGKEKLPTVIFDEIDTGVSGEIANKMGQMMARIAKDMQVITITHLPQVAALGKQHYKVFKTDNENSTISNIIRLDADARVKEIASMLGGNVVNEAAINNAKSLLSSK